MKVKVVLCDICEKKIIGNDAAIKFKYRAKRKWWLWHKSGWEKIDICANCLDKIIFANEEIQNSK